MPYELKLFAGNAHHALAEEIAACLGITLGQAEVTRFSDGEVFVQLDENVRGADVFIVQSPATSLWNSVRSRPRVARQSTSSMVAR